jgi:hypothetical protein
MRSRLAVALLLALSSVRPAAATTSPVPHEARWGATWLADRVGPGGYVAALDGKPDPATTVVIGLALAAAGVAPKTLDRIATYLGAHIDDYAVADGKDRPGALGRLALLASAAGRDPNAFGGTAPTNRLVDRILATRTTVGPYAGLLADPTYNGVFSHALGLLGVAAARSLTPDQQVAVTSALDFLVAQQCADGGWQNAPRPALLGTALTSCGSGANGPDTNAASLAAQALSALHRTPRTDPLGWWAGARNTKGGYGYLPGGATDADSTALAVQALLALHADTKAAYGALLALQLGCVAASRDRGAFAYMAPPSGPPRPNVYATAEAVPAAARRPFPIPRATATTGTVARAPMSCTTPTK